MRILIIAILFLLAGCPAQAESFEIGLSGLAGEYAYLGADPEAPQGRQMVVTFSPGFVGFESIRLKIFGVWEQQGEYEVVREVGGIAYRDTLPFIASFQMVLTTPDMGDDVFWARIPEPWGTMEGWESGFLYCCPNRQIQPDDAALLVGQEVTIQFYLLEIIRPEDMVVEPMGRLDEVYLVFEGAVPVASGTWGGVKALYR